MFEHQDVCQVGSFFTMLPITSNHYFSLKIFRDWETPRIAPTCGWVLFWFDLIFFYGICDEQNGSLRLIATLPSLYSFNISWLATKQEVCIRAQKQAPKSQPSPSVASSLSVALAGEIVKGEEKEGKTGLLFKGHDSLFLFFFFYIPFFLTFAKYGLQAHVWESRKRSCWNDLGLPEKNEASDYPVFTSDCVIQLHICNKAEESMMRSVLIRQHRLDLFSY